MENRSHALAAGAFVLLVTALLAGLALWLTRDQTAYRLYELSSKDSVSGLQPQAAVRYKGVAVGKVSNIGFDPDVSGNVLIRIAVNVNAPVSPTTFATLGYQGVTGLAHILLDDAGAPLPAPPAGASGLPRLPLQSSPLSQMAEQGPAVLGQVQEAMQRINRLLGDDNQQHLTRLLEQLGQASASTSSLAQRLERSVDKHLDPALAALPPLAVEARQTLGVLRQAGSSTADAAEAIGSSVRRLGAEGGPVDDIASSSQTLGLAAERFTRITLPRLDDAADATKLAARRLGRTAAQIGDNPQALLYGPGRAAPGPGEPGFAAPASLP